jgi:hypothetical protein
MDAMIDVDHKRVKIHGVMIIGDASRALSVTKDSVACDVQKCYFINVRGYGFFRKLRTLWTVFRWMAG